MHAFVANLPANLFQGVVTNLVSAAVLIVIPYGLYSLYLLSRQRDLDVLFGLHNREAAVAIRTSRIELSPGEPFGSEPVARGYVGAALMRPDYLAGALVADLLRHRPMLFLSIARRHLRRGSRIAARLVTVTLDASPPVQDIGELFPSASLVLIGGPIYNPIVHELMNRRVLFFQLGRDPATGERVFYPDASLSDTSVPLPRGRVPEPARSQEIAIVERHWDASNQRALVALYGLGSRATAAASQILVEQYRSLANLTRATGGYEASWAVMIALHTASADLSDEQNLSQVGVGRIEWIVTPTMVLTPPEPTSSVGEAIKYFYKARMRKVVNSNNG